MLEEIALDVQAIQWIALVARWFHVVAAAMWIGASFYIISWENKFERANLPEGVAGTFWTIQGGDFYYVEKIASAPAKLPDTLHWFKYEAYLTWVSGFCLLCFVFYFDTRALLDTTVLDLSPIVGIAVSTGSLLGFWWLYNLYCKTSWAKDLRLSAVFGIAAIAALTWFFTHVFSQQAAILHVGAVLGTIMSANVFFEIIPWHRRFVAAIEEGHALDDLIASRPGFRSRHNHYLTLPVFFIMLAGHFPVVVGQPFTWMMLPAIAVAAACIKQYHTLVQKKEPGLRYLIAGLVVFIAVVLGSAAARSPSGTCGVRVSDRQVHEIIAARCVSCHSRSPTDDVWLVPPNGVVFDSAEDVNVMKDRIFERAVVTKTMPSANKTGMLPAERQLLGCWIEREGEEGT